MPPIDPKFIVNSELLPKKYELTEFNIIDNKSQFFLQPIDKQESKQNLTLENESTTEKKETNSGQIKEKKIKGKKTKENFLKIQVKGEGEKFENLEFDRWRKELLDDENWCATLVRFSGNDASHLAPTQRRLQGGARAQFPPKRFQAIYGGLSARLASPHGSTDRCRNAT